MRKCVKYTDGYLGCKAVDICLETDDSKLYEAFCDLGQLQYFMLPQLFADKERYDQILNKLFSVIIEAGITSYSIECRHDSTLTATNYLKKDKNYYDILGSQWSRMVSEINQIFDEIGM